MKVCYLNCLSAGLCLCFSELRLFLGTRRKARPKFVPTTAVFLVARKRVVSEKRRRTHSPARASAGQARRGRVNAEREAAIGGSTATRGRGTMEPDFSLELADLEKALAAVRARSSAAAAQERRYISRIKELEDLNHSLVARLKLAGALEKTGGGNGGLPEEDAGGGSDVFDGSGGNGGGHTRERRPIDGNERSITPPLSMPRSHSMGNLNYTRFSSMRTKSNKLTVVPVLDGEVESDSGGSLEEGGSESSHRSGNTNGNGGAAGERSESPLRGRGERMSEGANGVPRVSRLNSDSRLRSLSDSYDRLSKLSLSGMMVKVPFQLLLCNDDGCRIVEPEDRAVRSTQSSVPHSQLIWGETPRNVLIVKKPNDTGTSAVLPLVVELLQKKGIKPWVEPAVHWETGLGKTWQQDDDPHLDRIIDFVVCLGGDGTILWVNNLFPKAVPPVVSFAMGSLGFLTAFEEESIPKAIDDVVNGDFFITQRSRLVARVVLADGTEESEQHVVLNEVVIDRGSASSLVSLDLGIDGQPVTKVLADGLMVATPTGSTAYALAAGGSMVHPGVSGVLVVPICPHSLSFRPLVLPDSVVLSVRVLEDARTEAHLHFDGKHHRTLRRGESLVVKGWRYPVPAICNGGESVDWFTAVNTSLLWNMRGSQQKAFEQISPHGRAEH